MTNKYYTAKIMSIIINGVTGIETLGAQEDWQRAVAIMH